LAQSAVSAAGAGPDPDPSDDAPVEAPPVPGPSATDSSATGPTLTLAQVASMWPAVLEAVKSSSRAAWTAFSTSAPISLANGELAVALADAGTEKFVRSSGHDERLRQALADVLQLDVRVDVVLDPDRAAAGARVAASVPRGQANGPAPSAHDTAAPVAGEGGTAAVDEPSPDDADADAAGGVDLAIRELGATHIGEIEH
jgi:DNA polymerase-3 subunit gamma/tau